MQYRILHVKQCNFTNGGRYEFDCQTTRRNQLSSQLLGRANRQIKKLLRQKSYRRKTRRPRRPVFGRGGIGKRQIRQRTGFDL